MSVRTCRDCAREMAPNNHTGAPVRHMGRGLCNACYKRARNAGTLIDHERVTRPYADVLEDFEFLARQEGLTPAQAAERMGIRRDAIYKAQSRARQAEEAAA